MLIIFYNGSFFEGYFPRSQNGKHNLEKGLFFSEVVDTPGRANVTTLITSLTRSPEFKIVNVNFLHSVSPFVMLCLIFVRITAFGKSQR